MPSSVVSQSVPVVSSLGIDLVSVVVHFRINPETCLVEYLGYDLSGLSDMNVDLLEIDTGVSVDVNVMVTGPDTERCETPPDTCSKTVTITISVTKVISVLGISYRRAPYTVTAIFKTNCYPQCCNGG